MSRIACCSLTAMLLVSCATEYHRVDVDANQFGGHGARVPVARLACGYHLQEVEDGRPSRETSGNVGAQVFVIQDAPGAIRKSLLGAGVLDQPASGSKSLQLRLMQMYIATNIVTKIPVVVYRAKVDDGEPFVIRSQLASLNWNGSVNEVQGAYSQAFQDANRQLLDQLNARCGASTPVTGK